MKTINEILKEIKLLMEFAVPKDHLTEAEELVEKYSADTIALNVLHAFYSYLPEALDDAILSLVLLDFKKGAFLMCAKTILNNYLYLSTREKAEFLGLHKEGVWDREILDFFGCENRDAFIKRYKDLSIFNQHHPVNLDEKLCPACSCSNGEHHVMGCPVEVCPWCEGQLTSCNCRFNKLGTEEINNEEHLESLQGRLNKKGRIPYDARKDRPAYPSDSGPARGIKKD